MSSSARLAQRASRSRETAHSAESVRDALVQLERGSRNPTQSLFDQIAECKDAVKASASLARAIAAERQTPGEMILPAPGWLLPP